MSDKFRDEYRIPSNRLNSWDYSSPAAYFITICTANFEPLFGDIVDGKMTQTIPSDIALKYWRDLPNHYQNIELDEFVVMPNHVHFILSILYDADSSAGSSDSNTPAVETIPVETIHELSLQKRQQNSSDSQENKFYLRRKMVLSKIVGRYKMQTAKEVNKFTGRTGQPLWQRNYYDRIIRNEDELNRIRLYIAENPINRETDQNNPHILANRNR